ncbi:5'-3' exoribonuclease 1 [Mycena chlorophos]|uniref:5'-3' exoribonuclease 1 n=1 Tax=Mycena chlorophos TaxID=658473 RepID=A0A8H6WLJ8_MYCCL|nr:5'-3' exoribonuclease 1 [Mycena chlorophos]
MGIPKFFRYISERYPLTSQLIQENKIPEFDNLYLDFNGIIHNCSHPNDEDAHFRLSEEQIFTSIFAYVDLLFGKIKPKKLFFMAVDGVAPRAKMNQQRGRRFRTAKEAREIREKAEAKGEVLPTEKAFDSNCITPGTPFMARLSDQLRYFVNKKITEDSNWRDVEVVLSGHEVPGEGEHKIMEYIRHARAQPDYNPNVRHCLYGLDADLIMLSLLSHDPHFCLLREEVKFGPARGKRNASLESTNFYLLHLSLMREYLDLEFHEIAPVLPFEYDLERIIDDFVLLAVFVGNDFLPHLPDLHIHENGLQRLWEVYRKVLPGMDGYINGGGVIDTRRLQIVLDEMGEWEQEVFEKEYADLNWYKGKQAKVVKEMEVARKRNKLVLTRSQRDVFEQVQKWVVESKGKRGSAVLAMRNEFPARDRVFVGKLAEDLHLGLRWDEFDEEDRSLVTWRFPGADNDAPQTDEDDEDPEAEAAVERVLKKYATAPVADDDDTDDFDARHARSVNEKMDEWKRNYYKGKLEIDYDDPQQMGDFIFRYVEGLQWVMHYYYSGVASWGWFYDYHYAPRISDLRGVDQMTFEFDLGRPFRPFEQLMGVLPVASKDHIPLAYQDLMYTPNSPIRDFYPLEFEQDLNGKKADWEAVVKIPFIDEKRLLAAMSSRENRLTQEEKQRNSFGTSTKFSFNHGEPTIYPSSLPGFFPPLNRCMCKMEPFDLPTLDGLHPVLGLVAGVKVGTEALAGFPSLNTLPHTAVLGVHGVNVHGTESKNKSIVVHIQNPHEARTSEDIAKEYVGQRVFTGWPFLREGRVVGVSDSLFKYEKIVLPGMGDGERVVKNPHSPAGLGVWRMKADRIEQTYSKRTGVITGSVDVLLHVRPLKGLKRLESGALVKDYEDADKEQEHAVQMTLSQVASEDPRFMEREAPPLSEEFPEGSKIFFLGEHAYGVAAAVSATTDTTLSVILAFFPSDTAENAKFKAVVEQRKALRYLPSFRVAEMVGISGRALSRITSSFMILTSDGQKTNLGLSLKFDAKALKVIDYTRKDAKHWEFSEKAIDLIRQYKLKFPALFANLDSDNGDIAKASDLLRLPGPAADTLVRDAKAWLKTNGVRDLEPVSLFCDQLGKDTVMAIEELADTFTVARKPAAIKKAVVKGIPRQAVLKPAHAVYRLQSQVFALGDRVTMVQDSGSVPLSVKGVVVGLNAKTMDVVWDAAFMAGTTMGDRCSQYRGSSVEFNTCLNLTNPQFVTSTAPKSKGAPVPPPAPRSRWTGPQGDQVGLGRGQTQGPSTSTPVAIMSNPNRGRGGVVNTRGGFNNANGNHTGPASTSPVLPHQAPTTFVPRGGHHGPGFAQPRGRGGFLPGAGAGAAFGRGRGGFVGGGGFRGGAPRGGYRGRGRGGFVPGVPS